jgi:hypothetical protein
MKYLEKALKDIADRAKRTGTVLDDKSIAEFISFCLRDVYEISEALMMQKCRDFIENEIASYALDHTGSDELSDEERTKALAAINEDEMGDLVDYLYTRLFSCDDPTDEVLGHFILDAHECVRFDLAERVASVFEE